MKKIILIVFGLFVNTLFAQYTLIPDEEFESRLIVQGIDTEGTLDGQVLTDDIDHIIELYVFTQFPEIDPLINDLTGIEDFVSLEILNFGSNNVEQVDLSQNINLKSLVCKFNNLTSLDVSNNLLLEVLDIINCPDGTCEQENVIANLDLSNNLNLTSFGVSNNNFLNELDLSSNIALENLIVNFCVQLNSLNIKNGNNSNLTAFIATNNSLLNCITVDDPLAATNGDTPPYDNWNIQEGVVFSEDCILGVEDFFASKIRLYPNPVQEVLYLENKSAHDINTIIVYDVLGRLVLQESNPKNKINISHLNSGFLFVQLETENGVVAKKVVKK